MYTEKAAASYNDSPRTIKYQEDLAAYNTKVDSDAPGPGYTTNDVATKKELESNYNRLASDYAVVSSSATSTNEIIAIQNTKHNDSSVNAAYARQLAAYNNLPDKVKSAGELITTYNENTDQLSANIATSISEDANNQAIAAIPDDLNTLKTEVATVMAANTETPVYIDSQKDENGVVYADLFGVKYVDQNGDGKTSMDEDILPSIETPSSLAEVTTMFYYLKRIADTSIDYTDQNGSTVKAMSATAYDASRSLMNGVALAFQNAGKGSEKELISTIETKLKTSLETSLKDIYSQAGITWEQDYFNYTFAEQLKSLAIDNYQAQTNQFIQTAKNLLTTYQAAMADSVWANNSNNALVETLTQLITDTQAKVDEGLKQFQLASASDDFLNLVYSGSAELPNSISAIWESMNGTIDMFGQSTSYMMNAVLPSLDPNLVKQDNGTVIFSNDFVQAHPLIFDAATALANSITQLANQFFNVTEDLQATIQPMVKISGYFDVSAPSVPQQVPSVELPTAPQQVVLKDIATQPQPRQITIIPVDLSGNPLENISSYEITAIPGVEIETPNTVNHYVPVNDKFTPTTGINYVAYKPINNTGHEGDGIQVKTQLGEGTSTTAEDIVIVPVDISGQPLYGHGPITIQGVPGYPIATPTIEKYTPLVATITPTYGVNEVTYVPINNAGHEGDGIQVKTQLGEGTSTTAEEIILVPVDISGQPLYGHGPITVQGVPGYPVTTPVIDGYTPLEATITPTYGENKVTYIPVNNSNVGEGIQVKTGVAEPTTPEVRVITIIPVDLSGNPLEFAPQFTIEAIPGVTINTPVVTGYTPQKTTFTPTPGVNKIVYIPINYAGNEGDGIQVKTAVSEGVYHEEKTVDANEVPEKSQSTVIVEDGTSGETTSNQVTISTSK